MQQICDIIHDALTEYVIESAKDRRKCMVSRGIHHVPGSMDHVMPCFTGSGEHDAALKKPGNIVYFCTSRDACWTNHDWVIQTVIKQYGVWSATFGFPSCAKMFNSQPLEVWSAP